MERNPWVTALVVLLNLMLYISDVMMKPQNVIVHIWEGNVTVTWDPPQESPVGNFYVVQLSDYSVTPNVWHNVSNCNQLTGTTCNIGKLPPDSQFHVKIGVMHRGSYSWSIRRMINIKRSQLLPPSFSLLSTPFSVVVRVQRKNLDNIFPYGLVYTVHLWPEGKENQTQYDDDADENDEMKFSSLQPLQVYCVLVEVKTESGVSNTSPKQCIKLPIDITLIICFVFLGLLGFASVLIFFVCCFLKRPRKMPAALKPIVNRWQPMIVGSVHVETVIEKGWLLFTNKEEVNIPVSDEKTAFTEKEKDWRESMDSGVSMEQINSSISNTRTDGQIGEIQEDSGCGSLKGTEGSGSISRTKGELQSLDEIHHGGKSEGREDSGLGLNHQGVSSSLEGGESGLLSEVIFGDGYRSQSPSSVDMNNETCDMDMAAPSGGYRSGRVVCMCSDNEYCIWCKSKKPLIEDCQSVAALQANFSQTTCNTVDGTTANSNYQMNNLIRTVNFLGMDNTQLVFPQSDVSTETCEFPFPCPLLLQSVENQDCLMDTIFHT
ncbi:interleukin-10 receptor subunit alpha [Hoplias malabaricus]|uniref:interleukin-10 receptor subunit alpha n=1 Tax=Hoplias malabaricus TaxID=27720 RepID=UPI0034632865